MKKVGLLIGKIIGNIILSILVIAILVMLYCYYQVDINKKQYVNLFGYTFFEVITGSMSPTIEVQDLVLVKIGKDNIDVDDIITYIKDDSIITHRVVSIENDTFVCKGDNNNTFDKSIKRDIIIGKVVKIIPGVGTFKETLFTPSVLVPFLVTFVLFGIYFNFRDKESKDKKKDELEN